MAFEADGRPASLPVLVSPLGASGDTPDVAYSGGLFLVVWQDRSGADGGDITGRLIEPDGSMVSPPLSLVAEAGFQYLPRVVGTVPGFELLWIHLDGSGRSLRRASVDAAGAVSPAVLSVTEPEDYAADPSLASAGDSVMAAWRVPAPGDDDDLAKGVWAASDPAALPAETDLTWVSLQPTAVPPDGGRMTASAFPNPFHGSVRFGPIEPGGGPIEVVDIRGRRVSTLSVTPARPWVRWDGRTGGGARAPAGVYFLRDQDSGRSVRVIRVP